MVGYNSRVAPSRGLIAGIQLLIAFILIQGLGLSERPLAATEALTRAGQAVEGEEHSAAASAYAQAAELSPWHAEWWEAAGEQALLAGEPEAALEHLQHVEWVRLSDDGLSTLSQAYLSLGDCQQAVEALQALVARQPSKADIRFELGLLLAVVDPAAAPAQFVHAADLDERYAEAAEQLSDNIQDALRAEQPAHTYTLIGQTLGAQGEWELAAVAFETATEQNPEYAEAWAYLGEARGQIGEDGLPALQQALALNPDSLAANLFLALYHERTGDLQVALERLQSTAALYPENPALQAEIGRLSASLGDLDAALAYYQQATELAPGQPLYWKLLAEFTINYQAYVGKFGLSAAREALALYPNDPEALLLLARGYLALENLVRTREFFRLSLEADPDYVPTHLYLGMYYLANGELAEAQQALTHAVELDPNGQVGLQARELLTTYFP